MDTNAITAIELLGLGPSADTDCVETSPDASTIFEVLLLLSTARVAVENVVGVAGDARTLADVDDFDVLLVSIGITVNPSKIEVVAVLTRAEDSVAGAWPVIVMIGLSEVGVGASDVDIVVVESEGGGTTMVCVADSTGVEPMVDSLADVDLIDEVDRARDVEADEMVVEDKEGGNGEMGIDERPGVKVSLVTLVLVELGPETGVEPSPKLEIVSVVIAALAEIVLAKPKEKLGAIEDSTLVELVLEAGIELKPRGRLDELPVLEAIGNMVELDWFCCAVGKLVVVLTLGLRVV